MSATVEITEDGGTYTAIDTETGAAGSGRSKAMALVSALGFGGTPLDALRRSFDEELRLRRQRRRARRTRSRVGV